MENGKPGKISFIQSSLCINSDNPFNQDAKAAAFYTEILIR